MNPSRQGFSKVLRDKKERATLLEWQKLQRKPESEGTLMDYITLAPEIELPSSLEEVDAHSVYAAFEKIPDGRCKRGIRYPVALILTLIVLAKLTGEPKLSGVSQWARLRGKWLNEVLPLQQTNWPAAST